MYAALLGFAGFRVVKAGDGETAVSSAHDDHPEVILMDLDMPGTDGWTAIERLKSDPATAAIPILAASGHSLPHHIARALEAGCKAFLVKPCLPEDLLLAVMESVGWHFRADPAEAGA
jgi:two-component system, cell cycle response regulator DivK